MKESLYQDMMEDRMIRVKKTRNHYWAWVSRRCSTTQATVQFYINRGFYVQTWDSKNRKWRNH